MGKNALGDCPEGLRREQEPFLKCSVPHCLQLASLTPKDSCEDSEALKYIFGRSVHICFLFVMFCQHFCDNRAITPALGARSSWVLQAWHLSGSWSHLRARRVLNAVAAQLQFCCCRPLQLSPVPCGFKTQTDRKNSTRLISGLPPIKQHTNKQLRGFSIL